MCHNTFFIHVIVFGSILLMSVVAVFMGGGGGGGGAWGGGGAGGGGIDDWDSIEFVSIVLFTLQSFEWSLFAEFVWLLLLLMEDSADATMKWPSWR